MNVKNFFVVFLIVLIGTNLFAISNVKRVQQPEQTWQNDSDIQTSERGSQGTEISVIGFVQIFGNEPVTIVGFVDSSGKEYTLAATDEVLTALREHQGQKLVVAGKHIPAEEPLGFKQLKDGTLYVSNFMRYSEN